MLNERDSLNLRAKDLGWEKRILDPPHRDLHPHFPTQKMEYKAGDYLVFVDFHFDGRISDAFLYRRKTFALGTGKVLATLHVGQRALPVITSWMQFYPEGADK